MYSNLERRDQLMIRAVLTIAWLFASVGAFLGILGPAGPVEQALGSIIVIGFMVVAIFGFSAALGVAFGKYGWEWVSAWFAAGGVFIYASGSWYLVILNGMSYQRSAYLTSMLFFMVYRGIMNAAHARKIRSIVTSVERMVRDHDGD